MQKERYNRYQIPKVLTEMSSFTDRRSKDSLKIKKSVTPFDLPKIGAISFGKAMMTQRSSQRRSLGLETPSVSKLRNFFQNTSNYKNVDFISGFKRKKSEARNNSVKNIRIRTLTYAANKKMNINPPANKKLSIENYKEPFFQSITGTVAKNLQSEFKKKYKVMKILGNGSNSKVYLARERATKKLCAVKKLSKNKLKEHPNELKNFKVAV